MLKTLKTTAISFLEIILAACMYAMFDNIGGIVKYAVVLILCGVFLFLGRKNKWSLNTILCISLPTVIYVFLGCISSLLSVNFQINNVKTIIYWLVPLMFAFSLGTFYEERLKHVINVQFLGSILGYALFDVPFFSKIVHWESIYSFVFGIFFIYYIYNKKYILSIVAFLFVIFTEKRIVLLGIAAAVFMMVVVWFFQQNKKLILFFWTIIITGIYGYLYMIYSGIMEAICWGANINTNGRVEIYSRIASEFEFSPGYFGSGLGVVEKLLECWNIPMYSNLHNDLLKFYIELGFLGLLIFLLSYGTAFWFTERYKGKSQAAFLFGITVYHIVLLATDNVSIYMIYLVPFYSILFAALGMKDKTYLQEKEVAYE